MLLALQPAVNLIKLSISRNQYNVHGSLIRCITDILPKVVTLLFITEGRIPLSFLDLLFSRKITIAILMIILMMIIIIIKIIVIIIITIIVVIVIVIIVIIIYISSNSCFKHCTVLE